MSDLKCKITCKIARKMPDKMQISYEKSNLSCTFHMKIRFIQLKYPPKIKTADIKCIQNANCTSKCEAILQDICVQVERATPFLLGRLFMYVHLSI